MKMKIGLFTDSYEPLISGVVVSVKSLKLGLEALGYEVYIIAPNSPQIKEEKDPHIIRIKGLPVPLKALKGFRWVVSYKKYLPLLKDLNLDIIHLHTEFGIGSLGLYTAKELNLPIVYTFHTMYIKFIELNQNFWLKMWKKTIVKYFDKLLTKYISTVKAVIVPTPKVLHFLQERYPIESNYHVIPTGFNLKPFYQENISSEKIRQLKEKLGLKDNFICLYVGRLSEEKEIKYLIEGFAAFHLKHPQSKFVIIGDGPDRINLIKKVKKLGLNDKIIFLGFLAYQQLGLYYQLGDVFLNASLFETQGLTYIEALAASLPLLVRYDPVLEGVIQEGENGLFYRTKEELIQKLTLLFQDPQERQKLALKAKESVAIYSQEIFAQKIIQVYQQSLVHYQKEISEPNNS
ncbi:alpha-monoglucosyldiacylglycerol synthase [Poinsettia branch-inducing phytoplasma]|uniref:alpha-monoglucosyldiacylglycerol synthase n=1 Tax=Poinsettia branch-inducing phytoplasma TaxID=138647 RepID=UPI0021C2AD2A|nr:glycosyltransferase [Poinsettia branch-inducing phytoplasma]